uniref:Putative acyl carrier protein n=1 Tax=Amycolatopsis sp. SANK 60206 TaxID=1642649 RepID=A0A0E3USN4_9PSEU|nr:putative acyl carrier protein [Amycolatopsis sp. SANK 60206]
MNQEPADTTPWSGAFEEVLREHLRFLDAAEAIDPDVTLIALGIDSFTVLVLLAAIEDRLNVVVPDEMVNFEVFATSRTLWNAIVGLKKQQHEARADG